MLVGHLLISGLLWIRVDQAEASVVSFYEDPRRLESDNDRTRPDALNELLAAKQFILVSVLFDFALSGGLFFLLQARFSRRINVILENLSRITDSGSLHPEIGGLDELSSIDRTVHAMAKALSAKLRRHVMTQNSIKSIEAEKKEAAKIKLDLSNVSLKGVVEDAVSKVEAQAKSKSIKIKTDLEDVIVCMDVERIGQVLLSLLKNAVKYAPEDDAIIVMLGKIPYSVVLTIADNGPGISYDDQDTLFDISGNTTASRARDFTGLDLAQCKAIVTAHGGTIGVDSEEGHGSSFWITLPYFEMDTLSQ